MNQTEILKYLEGQKTTRTITDLIVHCTATKPGAKSTLMLLTVGTKNGDLRSNPKAGEFAVIILLYCRTGQLKRGVIFPKLGRTFPGKIPGLLAFVTLGDWMPTAKHPTHGRRNKRRRYCGCLCV